jgi:pimeloyl-ACP methyl ester carboxylesterase
VLLLLADGSHLPVTELPGRGPWTFLVLQADSAPAGRGQASAARFLTRFGRVVVPDLRQRPGWGGPPDGPGFLDLVDDLDQVRTRAGLGRPVLVGIGDLAPLVLRAAADQPWAWRALLLAEPTRSVTSAELDRFDVPVLVLAADAPATDQAAPAREDAQARLAWVRVDRPACEEPEVVEALDGLLARLGRGPGWAGIAPDAPPR